MKINITSEKENPSLKRKEVNFEAIHKEAGSTPTRPEVREALAEALNVAQEMVFLKKLETKTGTQLADGLANVYKSENQARRIESEYVVKRNMPPKKEEEEE